MRRIAMTALLIGIMIAPYAFPQATGKGAIEGMIVRADSGEPISGAQVTLSSSGAGVVGGVLGAISFGEAPAGLPAPQAPGTQSVTTSADGKFAFRDLNAGTYRIAASANGFVRQEYGQKTAYGQGRPVFVAVNQTVTDASIRLLATGSLSGRVFDENGQPATGAAVQLLRSVQNVQGQSLQSAGAAAADDRGNYRIFGVPPGRYYLMAGTPPGPPRPVAIGGLGPTVGTTRYTLVYYPAATELELASPLEIPAGGETSLDMRVAKQTQTYHVRGRVIDTTGAGLPANTSVMLAYRFLSGGGTFSSGRAFDPSTGAFDLQNVAPGDYAVQVQIPMQNQPLLTGPQDAASLAARQAELAARPTAQFPIRVVDRDINDVVLNLSAGVSTTGRIVVEGAPITSVPNLDRMRLTISLSNPGVGQTAPAALPPSADGTFQVIGLRETEYRVQFPAPPNFYVKSIRYSSEEILGKPFRFVGPTAGTFEVTLRSTAARISGNVGTSRSLPAPGAQVVLVPAQRDRRDLYRTVVADQNGRFSMSNVPPGNYKFFSWEAIDTGAYFDPDFLKQFEPLGTPVSIGESSSETVDVRYLPAAP
jgi:5-hydroxyisourate hydrolase-like protein (transthyretin family)